MYQVHFVDVESFYFIDEGPGSRTSLSRPCRTDVSEPRDVYMYEDTKEGLPPESEKVFWEKVGGFLDSSLDIQRSMLMNLVHFKQVNVELWLRKHRCLLLSTRQWNFLRQGSSEEREVTRHIMLPSHDRVSPWSHYDRLALRSFQVFKHANCPGTTDIADRRLKTGGPPYAGKGLMGIRVVWGLSPQGTPVPQGSFPP